MARPGNGGSERPPKLRVYLTGFGPFSNVSDNPSAALVQELAAVLNTKPASSTKGELPRDPGNSPASGPPDTPVGVIPAESPAIVELCGWEVLEVSAEAVAAAVPRIHSALVNRDQKARSHLSSVGASKLADIPETQEEAEDGSTHSAEETAGEPLALALHFGVSMQSQRCSGGSKFNSCSAYGFLSLPSLLVCTLPFFSSFKSLYEGQTSGVASLFVHVPPFSAMSLQQQLAAALRLLALLGRKEYQQRQGFGKPEEAPRELAQ
ncbi:chromatin organization modifier domain-containing protein, putative [Eimeria brunetti]|uniref:Chromatin organization modifier domain-containing protein, putative n=1 Tax=Eimeria brunetti TaxID=51314 RepID=U6LM81_9EIME|nr:chromatin organization modifier domain-containing protein, putative [Eimeria brunetti]